MERGFPDLQPRCCFPDRQSSGDDGTGLRKLLGGNHRLASANAAARSSSVEALPASSF
jgi:hypothetical protein